MRHTPMFIAQWGKECLMALRWLQAYVRYYCPLCILFACAVRFVGGVARRTAATTPLMPTTLMVGIAHALSTRGERALDIGELQLSPRSPVRDRSRVIAYY